MADIADLYLSSQLDRQVNYAKRKNKINYNSYIWLTAAKELIRVGDMGNMHVLNTLKAIREGRVKFETTEERERWLKVFRETCTKRGLKELDYKQQ